MQTYEGTYLTGSFASNGNLILTPTPAGIIEAKNHLAGPLCSNDALYELLEDWICNGWAWVAPEQIGALTDAPIISPDAWTDDDGELQITEVGHVYAQMTYMIENPVQSWAGGKSVHFQRGN